MKNTVKNHVMRVLAIVLAMVVLLSATSIGAAALLNSVITTQSINNGTVSYASYSATNAKIHTMEFNPQTTNLMPLAYVKNAGSAATLSSQIADAEANGYTVHGAINGEFFSMTGNVGTLTGRLIGNGRVLSDHETNDEYSLVIDNEGNAQFVQSELAYHLYINGSKVVDVARINKRFNGTWKYDCICYFDSACGTRTDTVSSYRGVEVVFNKLNGTELIPEGVLEGEVVSVSTGTYGSTFSDNQFVLYAATGTAYHDTLARLSTGQKIQIHVEELNADAKEIMKTVNSSMPATYPIVRNGVNVATSAGPTSSIGQLSFTERAQRTALGVKEDGTFVYFVSSGRNYNSGDGAGLKISEVADAMVELGCKYAVNLDGGGSSTMIAGGSTKYKSENRAVGSVYLIVSRNDATTTPSLKKEVNDWVYNATTTTYPSADQQAAVDEAVAKAMAVYNNSKSMNGNFIRAYMDIKYAMGVTTGVTPKTYVSLSANDWFTPDSHLTLSNNAAGALVLSSSINWPSASYNCNVKVTDDQSLYFDIAATNQVSITIDTVEHGSLKLNSLITPDSIDSGSGDSVFNGKRVQGSIPATDIAEGGFTITRITFCTALWNAPSTMTVYKFNFGKETLFGDVTGDSAVNSSDAHAILRYLANKITLTATQLTSADVDGDGTVTTADARMILKKRVGLA